MSSSTSPPPDDPLRSPGRHVLDDCEAFAALDLEEKLALAAEIAKELGDSFRAGAALAGEAQLATLVHAPSGLELVLIPGGTFTMGFTPDDQAALLRTFDPQEDAEIVRMVDRFRPAMDPPREVQVRPFAMARRLLGSVGRLDGLPDEPPVSGASPAAALQRLARDGFRFPSEAEWEYVAREGRQAAFVLDAPEIFLRGAPERAETAWGVVDPERTVWLGDRWHPSYVGAPRDAAAWTDGDGPRMQRGALVWGLQSIDVGPALVATLSALRTPPRTDGYEEVWLRLVLGPDEAGSWRRKADAPVPTAMASDVASRPAATIDTTAVETLAAIAAMDLDAALGALQTVDRGFLNAVAARCLALCAYPTAGEVPLPEALSAMQRRVVEALARQAGIGFSPEVPVPAFAQVRRRWLGIDPPGVLERVVDLRWEGNEVRWPLWKAWRTLAANARDTERRALLPSPVDRFEAAILVQAWGPSLYGLPAVDEATALAHSLGQEGATRAAAILDELLALHRVVAEGEPAVQRCLPASAAAVGRPTMDAPPPIRDHVWGALLTAVVAGGGELEARWEPVVPFAEPLLSVWAPRVPEGRRDALLLASFRRASIRWALPIALRLLRSVPSIALAREVARALASTELQASYGGGLIDAWRSDWEALGLILPGP